MYLPIKKIGKSYPKEEEIKAGNAAGQGRNRAADMALQSRDMDVKQKQIHQKSEELNPNARLAVQLVPQDCHPTRQQDMPQKPAKLLPP